MIKECDIKLYEYICNNSRKMPHDDLYYNLLDWKDNHPEIREELARRNDTYEVCYIDSLTGESNREIFKGTNDGNPYILARKFYGEILDMVDVAELRRLPNVYDFGENRMGKLILSFEKEN